MGSRLLRYPVYAYIHSPKVKVSAKPGCSCFVNILSQYLNPVENVSPHFWESFLFSQYNSFQLCRMCQIFLFCSQLVWRTLVFHTTYTLCLLCGMHGKVHVHTRWYSWRHMVDWVSECECLNTCLCTFWGSCTAVGGYIVSVGWQSVAISISLTYRHWEQASKHKIFLYILYQGMEY